MCSKTTKDRMKGWYPARVPSRSRIYLGRFSGKTALKEVPADVCAELGRPAMVVGTPGDQQRWETIATCGV